MQLKNPSYEVERANKVSWAPQVPGQKIGNDYWAYRIKTMAGNIIVGVVKGTRAQAVKTAENFLDRSIFHRAYWQQSKGKKPYMKGRKQTKSNPAAKNDEDFDSGQATG